MRMTNKPHAETRYSDAITVIIQADEKCRKLSSITIIFDDIILYRYESEYNI